MNKLLSKLLGGLLIVTSIIGSVSIFGAEADFGLEKSLDVSDLEIIDHGNDFESATELALNTDGGGRISSSDDIDFFKFTTDASEGEYVLEVIGTGAAYISTYDFDRKFIDGNDFDSENSYTINSVLQPNKEYYLQIISVESDVSYMVRVNKWPDDHGYDRSSSTTLTLNEEVAGKINYKNDTDYFKFTANTKGTYSLECDGTGSAIVYVLKDGKNSVIGNITENEGFSYSLNLDANETCYLQIVSSFADVDYKVKMGWELLQNPNFDENTAGWTLYTEGGAVASGSRDTTVYESSDNAAYRIDCTTKGSALTHIQLVTSGLKVEEGKTYKLSFMAKSEAGNVEPRIVLMQKSSPWSYYAKASTVAIGAEWKLYNVYFTSNKTDSNARLTFFLGNTMNEGGKLYFDSMSFKEWPDKELPELLLNPSFDSDANYWTFWTSNALYANGARDTENFDSAPAGYRIECVSKGTDMTNIQLLTWGIKVNEGKRYKLTFRAKCEGGKATPVVKIIKRYSPWSVYAASSKISIGSEWNTYEVYLDCNTTDSDARLNFFLGNSMPDGSKLYLDSMSLVEVGD